MQCAALQQYVSVLCRKEMKIITIYCKLQYILNLNIFLHIKPGNLLLATDGTLKISDFGVAEVHVCFISGGMADAQSILQLV